jgi:hypothetical protein
MTIRTTPLPIANLKYKEDRLEYGRYALTGRLFEDQYKYKHGNQTMLSIPPDLQYEKDFDSVYCLIGLKLGMKYE